MASEPTLAAITMRPAPGVFPAVVTLLAGCIAALVLLGDAVPAHWLAVVILLVLLATIFRREGARLRTERELRRLAEQTSQQLAASKAQLIAALESTTDYVMMLDGGWNIVFVNQRALAGPMGSERGLSIGQNLWALYPETIGSTFDRNYRRAMENQQPVVFEEYLPMTSRWFEVHAYPSPELLSVFFADVTERKKAQDELGRLARRDPLTGLHNRRSFRGRLDEVLAEATEDRPVAILYVDVDDFKDINDAHGHPRGDAVLQLLARRLEEAACGADLIARVGGDEFAIISRSAADVAGAELLARNLIDDVGSPVRIEGDVIRLGVSVGVAVAPFHGREADRLFQVADVALYAAKGAGRRAAKMFSEGLAAARNARQALKGDLALALERGELGLRFQPLVDIASGSVVGFEALARWYHPRRGEVGPSDFIPLAEETGLIADIGAWVIRTACIAAAEWPEGIGVAVNVSSAQFRGSRLVKDIADALAASGLPPHRLELEITESALLQDTEANLRILSKLRETGLRIALDDFGTGYSSLAYLNRFPIDKIKIDRSFVSQIERPEARAIVQAVAGLGRALKLRVTGEGVETDDQLRMLREHECHEAQGFLFGPPLSAGEARRAAESVAARGTLFVQSPVV